MSAQLRIGVIGIGFGQKVLVPAFAAEPHCTVAGICASDFQRARRVADRLDLPKAYGNWEQLIADPDIDVVAIAVPPSLQPAIAAAALAKGKHVFCEKPMASSLQGASQMLGAARSLRKGPRGGLRVSGDPGMAARKDHFGFGDIGPTESCCCFLAS